MRPPLLSAIFLVLVAAGCGGGGDEAQPPQDDRSAAIAAAMREFKDLAPSAALARGPCLDESLPDLPDWVADIAHDPRQPIDDDPANQCERFRDGAAHHFVELTPGGELIRAE